ncbi:MAG: Na+/H+ antiporter subunit D [Proteobacteria bacterium]|nr:MAG: Na+/H+ antiporter subunit D [Pseudomonadota bacterium]
MRGLLIAPVVIPLATAVLLLVLRPSRRVEHALSALGCVALLGAALMLLVRVAGGGVAAMQLGDWAAPFGVSFVADRLGAAMVTVTAVIGLAVSVFAMAEIDDRRRRFGFAGFVQILLGGVCGAFLTGDVFNLYVWYEVMLIASFALLTLGGERIQIDGAVKYVALNMISTLLFLSGCGLLYGLTGTLNMADLHAKLPAVANQGLVTAVAVVFAIGFGIKAALFPLFFWLPASYHTPPVAVSALFAGLLTKVGVYSLIRFFTLIFTGDAAFTGALLAAAAAFTMVTGVLGAAAQNEMRRILGFHIVSQIGYMVMGLAIATPLALAGAVFYTLHHIVVKANLFLVSGVVRRLSGSGDLARTGGLYAQAPLLAALFLVPAFSLAGFPPLSGFWAKLFLVKAALEAQAPWIVAVLIGVGLLTVYSMTKIWAEVFWKAPPEPRAALPPLRGGERALLFGPIVGLAAITVAIGLWPAPLFDYADAAARELADPRDYVAAVLGSRP